MYLSRASSLLCNYYYHKDYIIEGSIETDPLWIHLLNIEQDTQDQSVCSKQNHYCNARVLLDTKYSHSSQHSHIYMIIVAQFWTGTE